MALLKYLKPASGATQISPRLCDKEVQEEVQKVLEEKGSKKRGEYTRISQEEKATVARYASENGVPRTLKHFKEHKKTSHGNSSDVIEVSV